MVPSVSAKVATQVCLGFRALKGGAVAVGVAIECGEPRVVLSTFLATGVDGDRHSLEPYAVAAELKSDPQGRASAEAVAIVTEGRKRQDQLGAKGLHAIVRTLEEAGCKPVVAALLVNRAGWVTDLLEYSTAWPEHVPVAEGLAVRDALRFALKECRLKAIDLDEKSLPELAAKTLDRSSMEIDVCLKALGATVGKPWRKEQKLACMAAWSTLKTKG